MSSNSEVPLVSPVSERERESPVSIRPADMITKAKNGVLDQLGFVQLPKEPDWNFAGPESTFPDRCFFLRGEAAKRTFSWSQRLMSFYNQGNVNMDDLIREFRATNILRNNGKEWGFPDSETVSFEIPWEEEGSDVMFPQHPNLVITSAASIAKRGEWCTLGHIEWGGGESIAKVIGGSQMWIITKDMRAGVELFKQSTYSELIIFMLGGVNKSVATGQVSKKRKASSEYYYHIAQPGDVIVQPSCAVHAVFTESGNDGKWTIFTGYEAIGTVFQAERGQRVINNFGTGIKAGLIAKELRVRPLSNLVRLLLVKDYRATLTKGKNYRAAIASSKVPIFPTEIRESNVTTHVKMFYLYGYDLAKSLRESVKHTSKKLRNQSHLPNSNTNPAYESVLTDMTYEEASSWPDSVKKFILRSGKML